MGVSKQCGFSHYVCDANCFWFWNVRSAYVPSCRTVFRDFYFYLMYVPCTFLRVPQVFRAIVCVTSNTFLVRSFVYRRYFFALGSFQTLPLPLPLCLCLFLCLCLLLCLCHCLCLLLCLRHCLCLCLSMCYVSLCMCMCM